MPQDAPVPAPSADPIEGRVIAGKFELRSKLAQGAMGVVYRAQHRTLDVPLALKLMHAQLTTDEQFSARFEREARIACKLVHPNAVRVFDCGREPDGTLYLAMELVKGQDLYAILDAEGRLAPARAGQLMLQTLSALGAAHAAGIVHRDVKPENIMVVSEDDENGDPTEVAKVCDFGIASIGHGVPSQSPRLTLAGIVVGTPAYISPEQARGAPVDGRSDLYSLGIVLYQCLTGSTPFDADSALGLLLKHMTEEPPPPAQIFAEVHPGLARVAMRAIAKDPADRFQSAREMRTAIRLALGGASAALLSMLPAKPTPSLPAPVVRSSPPRASTIAPMAFSATDSAQSVPLPLAPPRRTRLPAAIAVGIATLLALVTPQILRGRGAGPVASAPTDTRVALGSASPPSVTGDLSTGFQTFVRVNNGPSVVRSETPAAAAAALVAHRLAPAKTLSNASSPHFAPTAMLATLITEPAAPPPAAPDAPPPATVSVGASSLAVVRPEMPAPATGQDRSINRARVELDRVAGERGVTQRSVQTVVHEALPRILSCYRSSLAASPAGVAGGLGTLHLETDGDGVVVSAVAHLPPGGGSAHCVEHSILGARLTGVDTGEATADISLSFLER